MIWDAANTEEYDLELAEDVRKREMAYKRSRPQKTLYSRSKHRQGSSRKVGCGIAARRNKRWSW